MAFIFPNAVAAVQANCADWIGLPESAFNSIFMQLPPEEKEGWLQFKGADGVILYPIPTVMLALSASLGRKLTAGEAESYCKHVLDYHDEREAARIQEIEAKAQREAEAAAARAQADAAAAKAKAKGWTPGRSAKFCIGVCDKSVDKLEEFSQHVDENFSLTALKPIYERIKSLNGAAEKLVGRDLKSGLRYVPSRAQDHTDVFAHVVDLSTAWCEYNTDGQWRNGCIVFRRVKETEVASRVETIPLWANGKYVPVFIFKAQVTCNARLKVDQNLHVEQITPDVLAFLKNKVDLHARVKSCTVEAASIDLLTEVYEPIFQEVALRCRTYMGMLRSMVKKLIRMFVPELQDEPLALQEACSASGGGGTEDVDMNIDMLDSLLDMDEDEPETKRRRAADVESAPDVIREQMRLIAINLFPGADFADDEKKSAIETFEVASSRRTLPLLQAFAESDAFKIAVAATKARLTSKEKQGKFLLAMDTKVSAFNTFVATITDFAVKSANGDQTQQLANLKECSKFLADDQGSDSDIQTAGFMAEIDDILADFQDLPADIQTADAQARVDALKLQYCAGANQLFLLFTKCCTTAFAIGAGLTKEQARVIGDDPQNPLPAWNKVLDEMNACEDYAGQISNLLEECRFWPASSSPDWQIVSDWVTESIRLRRDQVASLVVEDDAQIEQRFMVLQEKWTAWKAIAFPRNSNDFGVNLEDMYSVVNAKLCQDPPRRTVHDDWHGSSVMGGSSVVHVSKLPGGLTSNPADRS